MKLLLPVAGKSSRFPGLRPKWLLTLPNGQLMIERSLSGLKLENTTLFDKRDDLIRKRNQDALALQQIALQFASPVQKATIADFASGSMDTAAAMPTQPGAPVKDQGPVKQSKINFWLIR